MTDKPDFEKTPIAAIRAKCIDCSGGSWREVQVCRVFSCPLWAYRMGSRPTTVAKRRPHLLDPEAVKRDGDKKAVSEGVSPSSLLNAIEPAFMSIDEQKHS